MPVVGAGLAAAFGSWSWIDYDGGRHDSGTVDCAEIVESARRVEDL